eukprot:2871890-Prymnesium_polylepis.2
MSHREVVCGARTTARELSRTRTFGRTTTSAVASGTDDGHSLVGEQCRERGLLLQVDRGERVELEQKPTLVVGSLTGARHAR